MLWSPSRRSLIKSLAGTGLVAPSLLACTGATGTRDTGLSPASKGFSMPAEWSRHAGTIMQFPPALNYCKGKESCSFLEAARAEWIAVAKAVARFEPVVMYVDPADMDAAKAALEGVVTLVEAPLSDGWARDTAPLFLTNASGEVRAACFEFNGWGGSTEYADDALVKWQMAEDFGVQTMDHAMVLEGGAVLLDGQGQLITTEMCLLHESRNPNLSKAEQEQILMEMLGVTEIIWLDKGWVPDPLTNGHVDGICAYVAPGLVLLNSLKDTRDENTANLAANKEILQAAGLEVVDLPATSYTAFHINFYVCNGALIVPMEGKASVDDEPLGILADLHPDLEVVGVEANTLGTAGGGIHCITQQVPEAVGWPF